MQNSTKRLNLCQWLNFVVIVLIAILLFLLPGITITRNLLDENNRKGGIPRAAWKLHQTLTAKFEHWAKQRLASSRATTLSTGDISGTEWPLFGAVFYLWATESLQEEWDKSQNRSTLAPKAYAAEAVQSAAGLVIDPKQAHWVKVHWGDQYLTNQNLFYRMLVIAGLTSHARLTGDQQYLPLLRLQVETLSAELDASPHGLLDDYPSECYPGDVLTAIAMIRKADEVLGTDHRAFATRALRGFQGHALDPRGLVPYSASAKTGEPIGPTRGCGNSYVSLSAPYLWPEQARQWYDLYTRNFWQETWTAAGFREFPRDLLGYDWYMDVDAGPVLKGYGFAACAFGLGAARINGRFDHAYPLAAELHAVSWPLANGTLLLPRLLSNATDAPFLGEAAILYILTRLPAPGVTTTAGGSLPLFVLIVLALYFGCGLLLLYLAWRSMRRWNTHRDHLPVPLPNLQFALWLALLAGAGILLLSAKLGFAMIPLLLMQVMPRYTKAKSSSTPAIMTTAQSP